MKSAKNTAPRRGLPTDWACRKWRNRHLSLHCTASNKSSTEPYKMLNPLLTLKQTTLKKIEEQINNPLERKAVEATNYSTAYSSINVMPTQVIPEDVEICRCHSITHNRFEWYVSINVPSSQSKIVERIIAWRIQGEVENHGILPKEQFKFCYVYSME